MLLYLPQKEGLSQRNSSEYSSFSKQHPWKKYTWSFYKQLNPLKSKLPLRGGGCWAPHRVCEDQGGIISAQGRDIFLYPSQENSIIPICFAPKGIWANAPLCLLLPAISLGLTLQPCPSWLYSFPVICCNHMCSIESLTQAYSFLTSFFISESMSQALKTIAVDGTFTDLRWRSRIHIVPESRKSDSRPVKNTRLLERGILLTGAGSDFRYETFDL